MSLKVSLCALMLSASLAAHAETRVRTVPDIQYISIPYSDGALSPGRVAINGDLAIVIQDANGPRQALPYQRMSSGQWQAGAPLLVVSAPRGPEDDDVVMGDGLAAIHIGTQLRIFERSGGAWVAATSESPIPAAHGLAISGRRILVARPGCNYDADIYEKSTTSGAWRVTGRIRGAVGQCNNHGALLDLDGDVALVRNSPSEIREYRRNGTVMLWPQVGTITPPAGTNTDVGTPTLSGNVAFTSNGDHFQREGSGWAYQGRVRPLDYALTDLEEADYRGGLLLSFSLLGNNANYFDRRPYLYLQNSSGGFDHVAALNVMGDGVYADVSGNHAVVSGTGYGGSDDFIEFFDLPVPLRAPAAVANDFETHDVSGWQQAPGSQFALATSGGSTVYRQSSTSGTSTATLTNSDWYDSEAIEAEITPRAFDGSDRWVGLAVRYIDADNQYYVTLRSSNKLQLKRNVAGAFKTIAETTLPVAVNQKYRVELQIDGSRLQVYVNGTFRLSANDTALKHGRAALMTYRARADFDNVFAAPTGGFGLAGVDFTDILDYGKPFTTEGGNWTIVEQPETETLAFGQTSTGGNARAYIGTPTGDQVVGSYMKLESYGSSTQGAWFGLLARWVDARTHYYLSVRSTGRLEIRRVLNGTITVLKSVPFTATPGRYYDFRFAVVGNELHAYVDNVFVAGAIDNAIAEGQYGLATYRAATTYQTFYTYQP
jgi:hypothetical protein